MEASCILSRTVMAQKIEEPLDISFESIRHPLHLETGRDIRIFYLLFGDFRAQATGSDSIYLD